MRGQRFSRQAGQKLIAWLGLAIISLLTGCSPSTSSSATPALPGPPEAVITFKPDTSYAVALQAITDLGLQPTDNCYPDDHLWHPMSQRDSFADHQALLISPTLAAPEGWLDRVRSLPAFLAAQTDVVTSCPSSSSSVITSTPPDPSEARIIFTAPTEYATALEEMANLGVRLTDPCYETALKNDAHPSWHLMGQESTFAAHKTLLVASTLLSPDNWLKQAQALPEVVSSQTPVVTSCP